MNTPANAPSQISQPSTQVAASSSTQIIRIDVGRIRANGLSIQAQRQFPQALEKRLSQSLSNALSTKAISRASLQLSHLDAGRLKPGASAEEAAEQVVQALLRNLFDDSEKESA
ncbi:MAG TPA: hypothetical protein VK638_09950 [Edaphobacter sp.]|nr:hypothetical protein [Edaphobacter sp.]